MWLPICILLGCVCEVDIDASFYLLVGTKTRNEIILTEQLIGSLIATKINPQRLQLYVANGDEMVGVVVNDWRGGGPN